MKKIPGGGRRILMLLLIAVLVAVLAYLGVVGMLVWKVTHVPPAENYDAIVVLGAQVKADGSLSLQLKWRLDAAYEAWQKENSLIVVCGAQGENEPMTEAQAMHDYLVGLGVPEDAIIMEDTSVNTRQNIRNAAALLKGRNAQKVLMVTSDYHLPRAMALAEDEGMTATGWGAPTKAIYWPKNYGREALAWIKYWMQKYLHLPLE